MKDSSNNYSAGKNNKKNKTNSDSNYYSKNSNPSKKDNKFFINSSKSKGANYLNETNFKKFFKDDFIRQLGGASNYDLPILPILV